MREHERLDLISLRHIKEMISDGSGQVSTFLKDFSILLKKKWKPYNFYQNLLNKTL